MIDKLSGQWAYAHFALGVKPSVDKFYEIVTAYTGPTRFYHGIGHITHGLGLISLFKDKVEFEEYGLLVIVFFFHDFIYEKHVAGQPNNERLSADAFRDYAKSIGVRIDLIIRGEALIMGTADHQGWETNDTLWPIINDADLAIFTADTNTYAFYTENIWKEYEYVGRPAFVKGRYEFMKNFMKRPIFLSENFQSMNARAHNNINAELTSLAEEGQSLGLILE
jgi:predicted metal-dependent HD superfamily phosphohydrolase